MYVLFVDLDGVLVDFDAGVQKLFGKPPSALDPRKMWSSLARTAGFYEFLPWMPEGRALWEILAVYQPCILTGVPRGSWAAPQKKAWCRRELGADVPVITCLSREKAKFGRQYAQDENIPVLIDDREKLRDAWEEMGGIFVHHVHNEGSLQILADIDFEHAF